MSTEPLWRGVAAALITLFDDEGAVDLVATATHARRLVDHGVRALLVAGTTGEADALTDAERRALVAAVRDAVPSEIPVLAGAGGSWTGQAVDRVRAVVDAGADALLVPPPRRCGDLLGFYSAVAAAAADKPVLAYHFPGVVGGEVPVEVHGELPVAGLKDSTG